MMETANVDASRFGILNMTLCALACALLCVLCPLSVPIGPIPVTLGVFAVYLVAYALDAARALVVCGLYLLMGLIGLPVFSGYAGGPAKLFGPTGGYLIGYLFLAFCAGYFIDRSETVDQKTYRTFLQLLGMVLGLAICYLFGTVWFMRASGMGFAQALAVCVVPFLAVDAGKIIVALIVGNALRTALRKAHIR